MFQKLSLYVALAMILLCSSHVYAGKDKPFEPWQNEFVALLPGDLVVFTVFDGPKVSSMSVWVKDGDLFLDNKPVHEFGIDASVYQIALGDLGSAISKSTGSSPGLLIYGTFENGNSVPIFIINQTMPNSVFLIPDKKALVTRISPFKERQ